MKIPAIVALLITAAAVEQPQTPDPNEQVCRVTSEIGSRLQRSRICKTRAEWEQLRREQRNSVDRAQTGQFNRSVDEKGKMH